MATTKTVTRGEFDHLCGDVKEVTEWIDGNGKDGAKTRIKRLEDNWDRFDKKIDRITNWLVGLVLSITGGVIVAIIIWQITK